jgi:exodeoxyribonuclease VII small subunit
MSDENALDSASFNKNYKVLKDTADWLSQQAEPDIDQLVPKVEKAMQAYQTCKDRLTKVQETLGQYFEDDQAQGEPAATKTGATRKRAMRARPPRDGDDVNSPPGAPSDMT